MRSFFLLREVESTINYFYLLLAPLAPYFDIKERHFPEEEQGRVNINIINVKSFVNDFENVFLEQLCCQNV